MVSRSKVPTKDNTLVFGRHAVEAVLTAKPSVVRRIYLKHVDTKLSQSPAKHDFLKGLDIDPNRLGLRVSIVDVAQLDRISGGQTHQGIIAEIDPYQMASFSELVTVDKPLIIACDQIQDPHNLGAVFRSAAVFGATGLVLSKDKSVTVTPTVHKVSSGATWRVCSL